MICKKLYGRSIKINKNDYQDVRINPKDLPYSDVSLDHIGPISVKGSLGTLDKAYILIITCLWSRAVNLLVCPKIDARSFLQGFQRHIFDYGLPRSVLSDNGSPIVSGFTSIRKVMAEPEVMKYLKLKGIKPVEFNPYPADASYLGGTVESLVKLVKNMLYTSISKTKLSYGDLEFLIHEVKMLTNKRPIAFKETLQDSSCVSYPLTPEILVHGYEIPSICVVPQLHAESTVESEYLDPNYSDGESRLYESFTSLRLAKARLSEFYYDEFLANLRAASTRRGMYDRSSHLKLEVGDIVAVKQKFTKPYFYPVGVVTVTETNSLDEVVTVSIRKGNREVIRRHVTDLIFLHRGGDSRSVVDMHSSNNNDESTKSPKRQRAAAIKCKERLRATL